MSEQSPGVGFTSEQQARADEAQRLRAIADTLLEKSRNSTVSEEIGPLRTQRDLLILRADELDPVYDVERKVRKRQGVARKITSWDPLATEASNERVMTSEELEDWVDGVIIEDPALSVRLGFTDEMTIDAKALALCFHFSSLED